MHDLLIIKTKLRDFKKLQVNIRFYKALGVDCVLIKALDKLNEKEINELLAINETYSKQGIGLILSLDIDELMPKLLGKTGIKYNFSNPKIRKSFYHFLAYLIKYGIGGFYLLGLENLAPSPNKLIEFIRELNKNTFFNKKILSLGEIKAAKKTLLALGNPNISTLSMVRPKGGIRDLFELSIDFDQVKSGLCLGPDNFINQEINFQNYPQSGKRLVFMILFFLKASFYIEESFLDFEDVRFLRKLFLLKNKIKRLSKINRILPKEKDILAFTREGEGAKVVFLANLTEKEVLLDLAFKVMDYKDYEFLEGSLTHRTLYRTIILRPYEAVAFEKL
ncbi:hypothetical protein [uncultured Anaerococcus sp.]|uniref:hypothetical protein n=1 Tax=uncultured Anaerococcus sp. TaxID=293428 RepID=UPI00288B13E2|nr:hypothetical protein [uncultured Anaerococcus sp.]